MSMLRSLGHFFLGTMFISGGSSAFMNPKPRAAKVTSSGLLPEECAEQATMLNGAVMVVAGTALALELAPRLAAIVLAGALIPTTLVGHPFWKEKDAATRSNQQIHFLKNVAMLGGLLLVISEKK